jgi:PAS domain-containing protein
MPKRKPEVPTSPRVAGIEARALKLWQRWADALLAQPDAEHLRTSLERVQAQLANHEQAARERQALLQAVSDCVPFAITLLNQLGQIVFVNASAREHFFADAPPEGKNLLRMLARVPSPLRNALLSDADHFYTHGSQTYHLSKRQLTLGGKPHSLLIVRPMTLELAQLELRGEKN